MSEENQNHSDNPAPYINELVEYTNELARYLPVPSDILKNYDSWRNSKKEVKMSEEQEEYKLEPEENFQAIYKNNTYDIKLIGEGALLSRKTEDGKFEQILMESVKIIDTRSEQDKEISKFTFTERKIPPVELPIIKKTEENKGTWIESKIKYYPNPVSENIGLVIKGLT